MAAHHLAALSDTGPRLTAISPPSRPVAGTFHAPWFSVYSRTVSLGVISGPRAAKTSARARVKMPTWLPWQVNNAGKCSGEGRRTVTGIEYLR